MKDDEYNAVLTQLRLINTIMMGGPSDDELQAFIDANEHADSIGPLMDPTAWMQAHDNIRAIQRSARALQRHRKEIRDALA